MNDVIRLEAKIDSIHERQTESAIRLEKSVTKMSDSMEALMVFQARAEERHGVTGDRLDKVETRTDKLWDMVHRNAQVANVAIGALGIAGGYFIKGFFI